jgi:tRNA pseudouridine55 synthase
MTSHDVVAAVRKHVRPLRVGHTGTLDPLASGLLILCIGEATKLAGFIEAEDKTYCVAAVFGVQTDTQDVSGTVLSQTPVEGLTEMRIREAALKFIGSVEQRPPAFSAIKVGGVRAYARARRHEVVSLKPRRVEIRRLEIESIELPRVRFLVECSKGTYVRALCSDLGAALGVGGCMESLRRLSIGSFSVADAESLAELMSRDSILQALVPPSRALPHMPVVLCTEEQADRLAHGMTIEVTDQIGSPDISGSLAQALTHDGDLLAVGRLSGEGEAVLFRPKRVLAGGRRD